MPSAPKLDGLSGVAGVVGVGADLQLAGGVSPAHEAAEIAGDGGFHGGDGFAVDLAGGAVQGDPVAFVDRSWPPRVEVLLFVVHLDFGAAGDAAGAHAAGNNGRVRGHAAAHGQDTLRGDHALDVLRRGFQTDQNDLLAASQPRPWRPRR